MHQIDIEELTGGPGPGGDQTERPLRKGLNSKERATKHREKMKEAGFIQVNVWLPPSAAADFQQAALRVRQDSDLTLGPLRRISTGKLERS